MDTLRLSTLIFIGLFIMHTISQAQDGSTTYVLSTDEQARKNLDYQHQLLSEESYKQLQKAGLKKGQTVWELGCGSGAMTEYIAKKVGNKGRVFAVDISKEQLETTKKRLRDAGLKNVTFILADILEAQNWPINQADIVYSRFVLMHMAEAKLALSNMKSLLKPGGVISLQESTFSTTHTSNQDPLINDYFASLVQLGPSKGVDFDIGQKLPQLCEAVGFSKIEYYEVTYHHSAKEIKLLVLARIDEAKEKFIKAGIADAHKINLWKQKILSFPENDPSFYLSSTQYHIIAWK